MIDLGFLLGFLLGCLSTAAVIWYLVRPPAIPHYRNPRDLVTRTIGAAAEHEVADLVVSTGRFVSSVRSLRHQVNQAHASLKGEL